jgi:hypothetical protein
MDTLYYSQLDGPTASQINKDIQIHNPKTIVLFCETEWEFKELNKELADVVNAHNIHVQVIFGSFPSENYKEKTDRFNSIELIHWPTHWVNWTIMCSNLLDFDIPYDSFDYPFISLNNKNHLHRCVLIDELTRNNLLDKGIVTWHRFPNMHSSDHIYKFKYYDDSIRLIGDDFVTKLDAFLIPPEYHRSFLHVICEATLNVTFITEKTWLPILYKKPWIIMADPGFHQKLVGLGFELYDEIIDYSFDNDPDIGKRAYAISENVKRISEQNVDELYAIIKPKAERNYNNYMRILNSPDYVPKIIKQRAKYAKESNYSNSTFTDSRYVSICERMGII